MIRRPPRSTLDRSSAASDVYKRQDYNYTYSEYRELKKTEEREKQESKSSASDATHAEDLSKGKASFEQRKDFARLEKEIKKLEEKLSLIHISEPTRPY